MALKDALLRTLADNRGIYLSGEELSSVYGVSRAAVWKAIKALREEGYMIEAVTNKGYVMPAEKNTLTEDSFRYAMPAALRDDKDSGSHKIFIRESLDSTNLEAKRLLLDGRASNGCAVIANHQSAGRGRLGRSFFSPENGLYLSIVITPDFDMGKSVLATVAAAAAVVKSIEDVCRQDARIKWVNDIYIEGRKVCGILTEAMTDFESGQIENLVIGIGINTSLDGFPEDLRRTAGAVDLAAAGGNIPSNTNAKSLLAAEIVYRTPTYIKQIHDTSPEFLALYRSKSLLLGQDIRVFKGTYRSDPDAELNGIDAKALSIDDNGGLEVIYADGTRDILTTGEVTIR